MSASGWFSFNRHTSTPAVRPWDVQAIRRHFAFPAHGRVVTNNAASTQPPNALLRLQEQLVPAYDNVHRGQSSASRVTTERFEAAYDDIAAFVGAPSRRNVVMTRNTTEAHNLVMYSLMSEFRDGDNVVTTLMEHNSNYVPWYAMCKDILPRFGRKVECRLARFDPATGELDLAHLASLVDARTKLVCCTGASNFFGTKNPVAEVRAVARGSGYPQPDGSRGSRWLIDGAQLVPSQFTDFEALDADYLSFSFHKMLAPFGVGALIAKEAVLRGSLPFLYGGDMIADGQVFPHHVGYNELPWKYAAGTPHILGTIVGAQAMRLLVDLALTPTQPHHYASPKPLDRADVQVALGRIGAWGRQLTQHAIERLAAVPGITIYGPRDAAKRSALVAFNVAGRSPMALAQGLDERGVESRAGCHCATLAHHALQLDPPASCRLSFYLYNTLDEVDRAVDALHEVVAPRRWFGAARAARIPRVPRGPRAAAWAA